MNFFSLLSDDNYVSEIYSTNGLAGVRNDQPGKPSYYLPISTELGDELFFTWHAKGGVGNAENYIAKINKNTGIISNSVGVGYEVEGAIDVHNSATITNNGTNILLCHEKGTFGGHNTDLLVKTINPVTLAVTNTLTIAGLYCYPSFAKLGTDIYILARYNSTSIHVLKSTDYGQSFSLVGTIWGGNRTYSMLISDSQKLRIIVQRREVTGNQSYPEVFYIESINGSVWSNISSTFSQDITVGDLTYTQLQDNCVIIRDNDSTKHFYTYNAWVSETNKVYLIHDEGYQANEAALATITDRKFCYFEGGVWVSKSINLWNYPFNESWAEWQRYYLIGRSDNEIYLIKNDNRTTFKLYKSIDKGDSWVFVKDLYISQNSIGLFTQILDNLNSNYLMSYLWVDEGLSSEHLNILFQKNII